MVYCDWSVERDSYFLLEPDSLRRRSVAVGRHHSYNYPLRRDQLYTGSTVSSDQPHRHGYQDSSALLRRRTVQCQAQSLPRQSLPGSFARSIQMNRAWRESDQGRREGGARGTCPPPKSQRWKEFWLNSIEFVAFNEIFSIFFVFWGLLPQTTPGTLCLYGPRWWRNPLFCPPSKQIAGYAPERD